MQTIGSCVCFDLDLVQMHLYWPIYFWTMYESESKLSFTVASSFFFQILSRYCFTRTHTIKRSVSLIYTTGGKADTGNTETASTDGCRKGYRSRTGHTWCCFPLAPSPASSWCLALYLCLCEQKRESQLTDLFSWFMQSQVHRHTWDGVVQDEPEESPNEHVRCEEHYDYLIQLLDSFIQRQERKYHFFILVYIFFIAFDINIVGTKWAAEVLKVYPN